MIRLADGLDVVPMLVSHFDSCFTIRRLDLWQPISPKLSRLLLKKTSSKNSTKEFSFCYYLNEVEKKELKKTLEKENL